jgi:hypothetical protein
LQATRAGVHFRGGPTLFDTSRERKPVLKHKLVVAGGIALVVLVVIFVMKKGFLKDVPVVGPYLTL